MTDQFVRSRSLRALGVGAVISIGASVALGDDIVGPEWDRFTPFTTFQEWDFNQEGVIAPDGGLQGNWYNEGKDGDVPLVKPGPGVDWAPTFSLPQGGTLDGVYIGGSASGSYLDFCVPNWIDMEPLKIVHIQINGVWQQGAEPFVSGVLGEIPGDTVPGIFVESDETFPGFHRWEDWEMRPNPDFETIRVEVPAGSIVNQVVIDTISFPTPGPVAALALAGLATTGRRR